MSSPLEGGRPLARVKILGFPVHLDLSFVIVMAILGYYPGVSLVDMVIWLLVTPLAVLVHELGHAVVARQTGARPFIALAGFGGVTTYVPPRPLSRGRQLSISLAGPLVGLALGLLLVLVRVALGDALDVFSWQASVLRIGIFTCIAWSLLNLLPVLPLDGGQAMRELLPGAPEVRARRAAGVSLVTAVLAGLVAYLVFRQPFVALFMVAFAVSNFMALRQSGPAARPQQLTPEQSVVGWLWRGDPAGARQALEEVPPGSPVDLAVHGAVLALTGDRAQGHALIDQELRRRPDSPDVAAVLVLTLTLEHDWDGLVAALQGPVAGITPRAVIDRAIAEARGTGREDVAGRLSALTGPPPR